MRYLITGGSGFIGSHLADALIARGDEVESLDNLSTGSSANIQHLRGEARFTFREGSILDEELVRKLVDECDVVVHLAASVGVRLICERPLEVLLNNVKGTEVVLQACAEFGRTVLIASTSEIYGKNSTGPLPEEADRILGPTSKTRWSYSTSKAVDEILAFAYHREHDMRSIVVRLFNTIGPRQTGAYGMVVPRFVRQALNNAPVTVFGSGEQSRSFCHVADTVAALIALLDHPHSAGQAYNIGNPREITILELARMVIHMTRSASSIERIPYDVAYEEGFEDMERRVPDISRIASFTGWRPSRSLEDALAEVIAFERANIPSAAPDG